MHNNTSTTSWMQKLAFPAVLPAPSTVKVHDTSIICAAGFEDRTLALASQLDSVGSRAAIINYKNWALNNPVDEIINGYVVGGVSQADIERIDYDRFDPDEFVVNLKEWLDASDQRKVLIDISTMSRLAIMLALEVCRNREVILYYAEAEHYGPTQKEYEEAQKGLYPRPSIQVYSGLGGVVRSRVLSSVALQGEPTALIAFMSMNEVLTQALIDCLCPSRLFLINGRPPGHHWREGATAWIHEELRREWPDVDNPTRMHAERGQLPTRSTSTLNYIETVRALLELYWDYSPQYRIVLSPTGSKMQAVACYLVKALHRDIHVEYPTPESFLKEYSRGTGNRWLVNFGTLSKELDSWRSIVMRDRLMIDI